MGLRLIAGGFVSARVPESDELRTRAFGLDLPHPVGLAAGFDKNGIALEGLYGLGFSFVEIGTVTPQPQPGNPKPRMFRLPEDEAIINRLGFNNVGAEAVAKNLERVTVPIPYGVNIGKNKWTSNEAAWMDYRSAAMTLRDFGSYFVVNVSSPNTPGLRALQSRDDLARILDAVRTTGVDKPIYVKVSPDQSDDEMIEIAQLALDFDVAGIVATNTTVARPGSTGDDGQDGGLSGVPLKPRAQRACELLRAALDGRAELIGVGGISSGDDLRERLCGGAAACQIYTSFVYRGPRVVDLILREYLAARLL
ncbi:MAG: quinone-dependent dihydroorotate dehydrogenase [Armatimonadota bacterium]|nr:quinone-dependent dihydroorotate dehydrogenase [Armatimonadota bacterium]